MGNPIPTITKFDDMITKFLQMKIDISNHKTPVDICWLRIDAQPVKLSLTQLANKWGQKYISFLQTFCVSRIEAIKSFMEHVSSGLQSNTLVATDSNEDKLLSDSHSTDMLYSLMTHIRDVKISVDSIKALFIPLKEQINLLKKHNSCVGEDVVNQLEIFPSKWEELIRKAFEVKEAILPIQALEMTNIRNTLETFSKNVEIFRNDFKQTGMFQYSEDFSHVYDELDLYFVKTTDMINKGK